MNKLFLGLIIVSGMQAELCAAEQDPARAEDQLLVAAEGLQEVAIQAPAKLFYVLPSDATEPVAVIEPVFLSLNMLAQMVTDFDGACATESEPIPLPNVTSKQFDGIVAFLDNLNALEIDHQEFKSALKNLFEMALQEIDALEGRMTYLFNLAKVADFLDITINFRSEKYKLRNHCLEKLLTVFLENNNEESLNFLSELVSDNYALSRVLKENLVNILKMRLSSFLTDSARGFKCQLREDQKFLVVANSHVCFCINRETGLVKQVSNGNGDFCYIKNIKFDAQGNLLIKDFKGHVKAFNVDTLDLMGEFDESFDQINSSLHGVVRQGNRWVAQFNDFSLLIDPHNFHTMPIIKSALSKDGHYLVTTSSDFVSVTNIIDHSSLIEIRAADCYRNPMQEAFLNKSNSALVVRYGNSVRVMSCEYNSEYEIHNVESCSLDDSGKLLIVNHQKKHKEKNRKNSLHCLEPVEIALDLRSFSDIYRFVFGQDKDYRNDKGELVELRSLLQAERREPLARRAGAVQEGITESFGERVKRLRGQDGQND